TLSQTRMGNYIKIPEYYCALLVSIPSDLNTYNTTNSISNIKPDVHYGEPNYIFEPAGVNDPNYNVQASIHPVTSYTAAHINVDSAWVISNGESHVKVGVFDTGIYKSHEEFDTIKGLFFPTMSPLDGNDFVGHGTAIAGIIGAKRNNAKGIAGIAGGNDSISKQGVSLYDCRVAPTGNFYYSILANALFHSVKSTPQGGFGINIANVSLVKGAAFSGSIPQDTINLLAEQIIFGNRNGVVYVGGKGNENLKTYSFPADIEDEIQMSIGSTGNDGEWCRYQINCSHGSRYGGNIDFVAPGSTSIISSPTTGGGYNYVGGTSMAAAHVSGVVGLMMSYYNKPNADWDNLVHEDCENILRRSVTDLTVTPNYGQLVGRDSVTGHGKVNAYQALKALNKNNYKIFHVDETHYATSSSRAYSTILTNQVINWPAIGSQAAGTYSTNIVELTTTLNYSFPGNYVIVDYWPLYKECRGWQDTAYIKKTQPFFCKISSVSNSQAVLKTYYFVNTSNGNTFPESAVSSHKSAISLYVYDPSAAIGITENLINQKNFVTFPNPSKNQFNIEFGSDFPSLLTYKVYDILGKEVEIGSLNTKYGKNRFQINLENNSNGLYILNVYDGAKLVYVNKLIKY
ncbi:MAG: S8 family serine peptidase, partial [Bacteroidia bacterium]